MKDIWRLLRLMRPQAGWMLLGLLLALLTLFANVTLMAVSGWFIAAMALAGAAGISMNYFSPAAIIRAMAILRTAGRYGERLVTHEATLRLIAELRLWFYRHLVPLVPGRLDGYRSGDLFSRVLADISRLEDFYLRVLLPVVVALVGSLVISRVAAAHDPMLGWILLVLMGCAGLLLPLAVGRLSREPARQSVEQAAELRGHVIDAVQGMAELTVHSALAQQAGRVARSSRQWIDAQRRLAAIHALSEAGLLLFAHLALWLVLWTAIPLMRRGDIDPPRLAMLALLSLAAFEAVMPMPQAIRLLASVRVAARRLFEIVDQPPAVEEPEQGAAAPARFLLEVQGLGFAWDEGEEVIRGLDLCLSPGRRVALLGPSGAGKSSLIPLLLGFRRPDRGRLLLGGQPIEKYRGEDLREWIAVAPQQVHLFNASIAENLRLAAPQASDAELMDVCRRLRLDGFLADQPDGLDTWVGETGLRLSGGQARRLAVARALLRKPRLLVLDEPGEGLDSLTEQAMLHDLLDGLGDCGLLLLTHHHAGLEAMDEILVLEQGRVIERGRYEELVQAGGWFAESLLLAG